MNRARSITFAATVLASTLAQARPALRIDSTATKTGDSTAEAPSVDVAVGPDMGVTFTRTVFIDGNDEAVDLASGAVVVEPAVLARHTGIERGFLHIQTDLGVVAYDVPIDADPDRNMPEALKRLRVRSLGLVPTQEIPISLSSAEASPFILAKVVVTETPVFHASRLKAAFKGAETNTWPLLAKDEALGGMGPGSIKAPETIPVLPEPPLEVDEGDLVDVEYWLPNPLNVDAARRQCGPAAWANILAYLDATFGMQGINFPQTHTKGVGSDGDNSFVGVMDAYVDRPETDTCNGSNSMECNGDGNANPSSYIRGIFEFLADFDMANTIEVSHQGTDFATLPAGCGVDEAIDRESQRAGQDVTFDWLCDRVQEGAGIFIGFGFYDKEWVPVGYDENDLAIYGPVYDRTGGHAVRVISCGRIGEQRFLRTLDDGQQDRMEGVDDEGEGGMCVERDGLRVQYWPVQVNDDTGRLELGTHTRQLETALALTPTF